MTDLKISRKQFRDEERRIKKLRQDGWTDHQIKRWLSGWRAVGLATGKYQQ